MTCSTPDCGRPKARDTVLEFVRRERDEARREVERLRAELRRLEGEHHKP